MQNKNNEKEIIAIKALAVTAAISSLAGGFILMYSKEKNKENISITPSPVETAYAVPNIFEDVNTPYMDEINNQWLYNHGAEPTRTPNKPPYKPWDENETAKTVNPVKDAIDENTQYIGEINDQWLDRETESTRTPNKPPYKPLDETEDTKFANPIKDAIDENAPYISEINNQWLDHGTEPTRTPNNPPYIPWDETEDTKFANPIKDAIDANTPYINSVYDNIMYDLDPSIEPTRTPNKPPYIPSDENTNGFSK